MLRWNVIIPFHIVTTLTEATVKFQTEEDSVIFLVRQGEVHQTGSSSLKAAMKRESDLSNIEG